MFRPRKTATIVGLLFLAGLTISVSAISAGKIFTKPTAAKISYAPTPTLFPTPTLLPTSTPLPAPKPVVLRATPTSIPDISNQQTSFTFTPTPTFSQAPIVSTSPTISPTPTTRPRQPHPEEDDD